MCWNNCYKLKRFENYKKKIEKDYKKAGMDDSKIFEIILFDTDLYRRERNYYLHKEDFNMLGKSYDEVDNYIYSNTEMCTNDNLEDCIEDSDIWMQNINDTSLYLAVNKLNSKQKEIIKLRFIDCYSIEYIANEILNLSISGVHYRLSQAISELKKNYIKAGVHNG